MRRRRHADGSGAVLGLGQHDPVPDGYPFGLSDARLDAVLRDMVTAIPGFDRFGALLPELKLTLILIGALERSRRDADQFARRSLWVALVALVVASVSIIVSIILRV